MSIELKQMYITSDGRAFAAKGDAMMHEIAVQARTLRSPYSSQDDREWYDYVTAIAAILRDVRDRI